MVRRQPDDDCTTNPEWTAGGRAVGHPASQEFLHGRRFRLERELGTGGMGEVRLAEDTRLHRHVAIKSVRADLCEDPEVRQRIERECLLHAKVGTHPHIVTLYDRFDEDGRIRLVMEYVDGMTLQARLAPEELRRNPLSLAEALRIALQVLDGLSRIHAYGIVHRDIKPSNIMLTCGDRGLTCAKLTDFGIARPANEAALGHITGRNEGSPGTPLYMAPEQIDSHAFGKVCPATDVYAMGIVVYQMVSGAPPFTGSITEIFHGHVNGKPSFAFRGTHSVPPQFVGILRRALAKRTDDRYASALEFREALASVVTHSAALSSEPPAEDNHGSSDEMCPVRRESPAVDARHERITRRARERRRSGVVVVVATVLALLGAWVPVTAYVLSRDTDALSFRETNDELRPAPDALVPVSSAARPELERADTEPFTVDDVESPTADEDVRDSIVARPLAELGEKYAAAPPVVLSESITIADAPSAPASSNLVEPVRTPRNTEVASADPVILDLLEAPEQGPAPIEVEPLEPAPRMSTATILVPPPSNVVEPPARMDRVRAEPLPPVQRGSTAGFRVIGRESYRKN